MLLVPGLYTHSGMVVLVVACVERSRPPSMSHLEDVQMYRVLGRNGTVCEMWMTAHLWRRIV